MRSYLTALMLVATLGLVSCGGGNDGASTGTPVVAQATIFDPTANGGCGNSWSYDGNGLPLTNAQQCACNNALNNAKNLQTCSAVGGAWQTPWYCSTSNATNPQKEQCLDGFWFSTPGYCIGSPSPNVVPYCW